MEKLLNNRFYFMGIAMIFVVLYHCYCSIKEFDFLFLFSKGYIGVDIFFFFSGLGLSFSYLKNDLSRFYKNRFLRIMPLYWVWAIIHVVVLYFYKSKLSIPSTLDIFGIATTLSYYGIGSIRSNWYLSASICFYLLFPLLFTIIKKMGLWGITSVIFLSLLLFSNYTIQLVS